MAAETGGWRFLASVGVFVAAAWVALFELNAWVFSAVEVSRQISWIFLPAAIRMLAVMGAGWTGVAGLYAGAMITNGRMVQDDPAGALLISAISAVTPLVAASLVSRALKLKVHLAGLRPWHLFVFAVTGAAFSASLHNLYFAARDARPVAFLDGVVPMFVGDLVGTLLVLYAAKWLLRAVPRPRGRTTPPHA